MKKIALLLLLIALAAGCGAYEEMNQPTDSLAEVGLAVGSKPPAFNLETLGGELFDPEVIKDKKVILNYWATWCAPCRIEMPDIAQLAREHPDDLAVVAVNLKEDDEMVAKFVEELGLEDFHILLDRTGELAEQFQIIALPTTYFLNSDGTIGHKHIGFMNYDQFKEVYQNLN